MSGRTAKHYGFRIASRFLGVVPRVEVTQPMRADLLLYNPLGALPVTSYDEVVESLWGWTEGHATARALRWMHDHGDPR